MGTERRWNRGGWAVEVIREVRSFFEQHKDLHRQWNFIGISAFLMMLFSLARNRGEDCERNALLPLCTVHSATQEKTFFVWINRYDTFQSHCLLLPLDFITPLNWNLKHESMWLWRGKTHPADAVKGISEASIGRAEVGNPVRQLCQFKWRM